MTLRSSGEIRRVLTTSRVGRDPVGIAIRPNGKTAYVTNNGSNSVTPIALATHTPRAPISVGKRPAGIAITPNGKIAYVTNEESDSVTPIDLASKIPAPGIKVGVGPYGIAITGGLNQGRTICRDRQGRAGGNPAKVGVSSLPGR